MTFDIALLEVCVRVGVRYVITKFSRMDSVPNFLTHGAPLRAREARARAPLQSNFDTPGDTSRLDANRFSRSVQPIFRDIFFFLFTRNNYTSGNRNSFAVSLLKLVSKRLFSFTVN